MNTKIYSSLLHNHEYNSFLPNYLPILFPQDLSICKMKAGAGTCVECMDKNPVTYLIPMLNYNPKVLKIGKGYMRRNTLPFPGTDTRNQISAFLP